MKQRESLKAEIEEARIRAELFRQQGMQWRVLYENHAIDVTTLAFLQKEAAHRWIEKCVRSVCHMTGWTGKKRQELRQGLWDFWKGKLD